MTAPLMPKATAVWLVENTTLTFKQIADFCELHELEIQAIADGDVSFNIMGLSPIDNNQLTVEEIKRCEADSSASLVANELERNVKLKNIKSKKLLSPTQRSEKPSAVLWILKNCPEIIDAQICKLIGTTKPTIESIRKGTHRDMANIKPKNPVAIGLCSEKDLDKALTLCRVRAEKANQPKTKTKTKEKGAKKMTKKTTAKKPVAKKEAPVKKETVKKPAAKKTVAKKEAPAKKETVKKPVAKKAPAKTAAKKTVAKKAPAKKAAVKKPVAKKAPAKTAAKKTVAKKTPAKKTAAKKPVAKKAPAKTAVKKTVAKKAAPAKKAAAKKPAAKKKTK